MAWIFFVGTTLWVIGKRDQLSGFMVFLSLFCWPFALVVAALLPMDCYPGSAGTLSQSKEFPPPEGLPISSKLPETPIFKDEPAALTSGPLKLNSFEKWLVGEPRRKEPPANDQKPSGDGEMIKKDNQDKKEEGFIWYAIKTLFS